jgi:NDP-sugar pyrophosphorylase family protein
VTTAPPALILAAGLGTRLRPLTTRRAKPAVPVAGTPLVVRILRWLRGEGVSDTVVNLHHLPQTIAAVLGDGSGLRVRVRYSWEGADILGSAGGPRQALDILGAAQFFIVNGDTLTDLALAPLQAAHAQSGALVTLAVVPNPAPARYGGLRVADDGTVTGVIPAGDHEPSWHFVGVQLAQAEAFRDVPAGAAAASIGGLYTALSAARPGCIRAHRTEARFWDIGTVDDYLATCAAFAPPGYVRDAAVRYTEVWPGGTVAASASLDRCVVADGVHVPAGAHDHDAFLVPRGDGGIDRLPIPVRRV